MAYLTLCNNEKCKLKDNCLRYIQVSDNYNQSYLANPVDDCVNNEYILFLDNNNQ